MRHVQRHRLHQDTKEIPQGELFFVHDEQQEKSIFILTPSTKPNPVCALGTKIKGMVFTSNYIREDARDWRKQLDKAMQQMAVLMMSGWSVAEVREDEFGYPETLYRCAYCDQETATPRGSCVCRITARSLQRA